MKILHIFDHSLPLHSGYTFRSMAILKAQRARGWSTVHLTTPRHAKSVQSTTASDEVDGFKFWRTASRNNWLGRTPMWPLVEMADTTRSLRDLVRLERPDILHAHSPALNAHPALRVGRELGIPVVYEVRGFWEDAAVDHGTSVQGGLRYRLSRLLETLALRRVNHVTTICSGLKRELVMRGIPSDQITIIPNAVDVDRFQPVGHANEPLRRQLDLDDCWVLGFCGSFYAYEGLDLAIRALPAIVQRIPNVRLLLVGGGPEDAALRSLVKDLKLESYVVFTGRVRNEVIDDYYSLIDLLVFPRKRMRLTELVTPMKPLEAMAQGLPVLASDVGGHQELIRHGETGLLFPADDVGALTSAVVDAHDSHDIVARIRLQGREFVTSERSWTHSVSNYEAVYEGLLNARQ